MMAIFSLRVILVSLTFLPAAYLLQVFNNSESCSTATFAAKTVADFWRDSTHGCRFEVTNLLKMHKRISANADKPNSDQISDLIAGHVRSALMRYFFSQLITLVSTKSLNSQQEVEQLLNQLHDTQDKSFLVEIWQKVIDESFMFMDADDILQQILVLTNGDLKLHLLDYLLGKYETQPSQSNKFLPLLTFGVTSVIQQRVQAQEPLLDRSFGRLVSKLPQQLLIIFQSWNYNVSVLNSHSNEYVFPERNNAAAGHKRFLFTFQPAKNIFRVKGKFKIQISASGLVTLGVPYDRSYSYLRAEQGSAFICLECAVTAGQWWQVLWPDNRPTNQQFVLFQNKATQELLCSALVSHEDLILISTKDLQHHINDPLCHWKVVKRTK